MLLGFIHSVISHPCHNLIELQVNPVMFTKGRAKKSTSLSLPYVGKNSLLRDCFPEEL